MPEALCKYETTFSWIICQTRKSKLTWLRWSGGVILCMRTQDYLNGKEYIM